MGDLNLLTLHALDTLPPQLLDIAARDLHQIFAGPTLLHLPGRQPEPLFVSVLLHGNEVTGLLAIQRLLRKYQRRELPRALCLFVGNLEASRHNVRRLDGQPDYNRVWPGTQVPACAETRLMQQVVARLRERRVFASVDLHNNTGINPHYACVNALTPQPLQLASLFSRTVVYFQTPQGTQSAAMAALCPAVTVECGKPGEAHGVEHAAEFVEACLHLAEVPHHPVAASDIHLFHTVAQVRVPEGLDFAFAPDAATLVFAADLERMNFQEMPAGTPLAVCRDGATPRLIASNDAGEDVAEHYFECRRNQLLLRRDVMPSMLTRDLTIVRQDCLCYLMERLALPDAPR
ncbi:MAG: M14 family metallopeptidase [Thiotrichales bacterium]